MVALDDKQSDAVEHLAQQNDRTMPMELRALVRYALRHQYQVETLEEKPPAEGTAGGKE
jgi:predicted transcriptional regulator